MAKMAGCITAWLIQHDAIGENDRSLYEYAICCLLLTVSPLAIVLIYGCIMGLVKESMIFILPFMFIRKYSGGFHMKHAWTCFICSCTVLFLCIYVTARISCSIPLSVMALGSVVSLCICSPFDSDNRHLDLTEKQNFKRTTIWISILFLIIYGVLLFFGLGYYAKWIAVGLILPAVSQIPVIIKKIGRQEQGQGLK